MSKHKQNNIIILISLLIVLILCYLQSHNFIYNLSNRSRRSREIYNNLPKGILKNAGNDPSCKQSDRHVRFDIQSHSPYNVEYPVQYPIKNANMYSYEFNNSRYNDDHDRIYNPLRFPYKRPPYFSTDCNELRSGQGYVSNNLQQFSEQSNQYSLGHPEFDSVNRCTTNTVPMQVRTQKWCSTPFQVGIITKESNPNNTEIYGLFGKRKYRHDNKWEYYTIINGVKVYVRPKKNFDEIFNNETISLINFSGNYTVTIYDKELEMDY
jgi:hypothetical protein